MTLRTNLNGALALYDTYTKNCVAGKVDAETLQHMKDIFFSVADEDKGFVFSVFLQFLKDEGIAFDVEQLQVA